jgi:hypothetical protein
MGSRDRLRSGRRHSSQSRWSQCLVRARRFNHYPQSIVEINCRLSRLPCPPTCRLWVSRLSTITSPFPMYRSRHASTAWRRNCLWNIGLVMAEILVSETHQITQWQIPYLFSEPGKATGGQGPSHSETVLVQWPRTSHFINKTVDSTETQLIPWSLSIALAEFKRALRSTNAISPQTDPS